ncbi:MAG: hypothetical protein V1853_01040 [bacterium]
MSNQPIQPDKPMDDFSNTPIQPQQPASGFRYPQSEQRPFGDTTGQQEAPWTQVPGVPPLSKDRPKSPLKPLHGSVRMTMNQGKKNRSWLGPIIAGIVVLLLGATVVLAVTDNLPFDIPYLTPKTDVELVTQMIEKIPLMQSGEFSATLSSVVEPRESGVEPLDLDGLTKTLANFGNISNSAVPFNLDSVNNIFQNLPADLDVSLNLSGFTEKAKQDKAPNFEVGLAGTYKSGGASFSGQINMKKIGEKFYANIPQFPLFLDVTAIKDKWVEINSDSLDDLGYGLFMPEIDAEKANDFNTQKFFEQTKTALLLVQQEGLVNIDQASGEEQVDGKTTARFDMTMDFTKFADYYAKLADQLKQEYGDEALVKYNQSTAEQFADTSFISYMDMITKDTTYSLWIDKSSAYPVKMELRMRLAPPDSLEKFANKQLTTSLTLVWTEINSSKKVNVPANVIDMDEAIRLVTGITEEDQQVQNQFTTLGLINSALMQYHAEYDSYPESLAELLTGLETMTNKCNEEAKESQNSNSLSITAMTCMSAKTTYEAINKEDIFVDVFTNEEFVYEASDDSFSMKYNMQFTSSTDSFITSSFINGVNTMMPDSISLEGDAAKDTDGDGLTDAEETRLGTSIYNEDSDFDGVTDKDEVDTGTDPTKDESTTNTNTGTSSNTNTSTNSSAEMKARDAKVKSDLGQYRVALVLYTDDYSGAYPTNSVDGVDDSLPTVEALGEYLSIIPTSPNNIEYKYLASSTGDDYFVYGWLESTEQYYSINTEGRIYTTDAAPTIGDTDSDGLSDIDESFYGTEIDNQDTDGDGYLDGEEVDNGYNPNGTGTLSS